MLFCTGISVHKIGAGFREATQEPRRSYAPCMLGAGIHEGGTTEVVLPGLHVKVCRTPRGDAGAAAVLRPFFPKELLCLAYRKILKSYISHGFPI